MRCDIASNTFLLSSAHLNLLLVASGRLMRRLLPGPTGTTKYSSASSPSGAMPSLAALRRRNSDASAAQLRDLARDSAAGRQLAAQRCK